MHTTTLRSRPARLLLSASLLTSLGLGSAFISVHRTNDLRGEAVAPPPPPISEDQAREQVVGAARQFVGAGRLTGRLTSADGTYLLATCSSDNEPPYQGTGYLTFDVPTITETPAFFREIARSMTGRGWREGQAPAHHPGGKTLIKDSVIAQYYPGPEPARSRGVAGLRGVSGGHRPSAGHHRIRRHHRRAGPPGAGHPLNASRAHW